MEQLPAADRWPTQVQEAFGFLDSLGFRAVDGGTYRLGNWTLFGNGSAGIHLDCDGDSRSLVVDLMRLDDNRLPERWWEPQTPRVRLGLRQVAELLAPEALTGVAELPEIEREADRAPHLRFWACVLRAVAAEWLQGNPDWFDDVASRLPQRRGNEVWLMAR